MGGRISSVQSKHCTSVFKNSACLHEGPQLLVSLPATHFSVIGWSAVVSLQLLAVDKKTGGRIKSVVVEQP